MNRTGLVVIALAFSLGGCGSDAPAGDSGSEAAVVHDLNTKVEALSKDVAALEGDLERAVAFRDTMRGQLADLRARLIDATEAFRERVRGAQDSAAAATAASEAAASRVEEVARDLAVLEQRYEVHLRRYHGG